MVTKTMELHVLPHLELVIIVHSFNLWMFRGGIYTFALIINYLNEAWTSRHAIVGLFEVHETSGSVMALQLQSLLEKIGLIHGVIAFVKDEGNKLGTTATTL